MMTPVPLWRRRGAPALPLVAVSRQGNVKEQVFLALESHGITCDRILEIMDEVKANPNALDQWFVVR